jgi:hypothetical protein
VIVVTNPVNDGALRDYVQKEYIQQNEETKISFYTLEGRMPVVDLIPVMFEDNILKVLFGPLIFC